MIGLDIPVRIDVIVEIKNKNNIPDSIFELTTKYNVLVKTKGDPISLMDFINRKQKVA